MTDFEAKAREIFDTLGMWMNYDTIGGAHINADHIPFIAQALREAAQSGAEEMRERAGLEEWQPIATAKDNVRYLVCNPAEGELIVMAMKRGDRWSDFAGRSVEPAPTHYCIRALPLPMNKTTQDA